MENTELVPSGSFLPVFLRRKWKEENDASAGGPPPHLSISEQYPKITRSEKVRAMNRIFTAKEIEGRMQKITKVALADVQKQIIRGEESYYEETSGHGNIFRGWDAFVDSRDAAGSVGVSSMPQGGSRRIPADNRWFASSCKSLSRPSKPPPSTGPPSVMPSTGQTTSSVVNATAVDSNPSKATVTETANPSRLSAMETVNEKLQFDDGRDAKPESETLGAPVESFSPKPEPSTLNNDESSPEPGSKRKRPDDEQGDGSAGRDAKKRPSDIGDQGKKGTPKNEADKSEEIDETPKTPVAAKKEENTPKRTDSTKRRSSRRKTT
jgi:hypothetical protein